MYAQCNLHELAVALLLSCTCSGFCPWAMLLIYISSVIVFSIAKSEEMMGDLRFSVTRHLHRYILKGPMLLEEHGQSWVLVTSFQTTSVVLPFSLHLERPGRHSPSP